MAALSKMDSKPSVTKSNGMKVEHFKCKYCRKSCFTKEEVDEHEKSHVVNKKLSCRICNKGFARRSYLHEHMVIHEGKQPFQCDQCPKKFSLNCNLVRHKRIHSGEKPHVCKVCGQRFTLKKNMVEHVRTHTGEKPFDCPHCGAAFARRSSLVRHTRTHTDDRSFECHDCGKTFSWKYYLQRHTVTHLRPVRERIPRKRRTKAEIARDKAAYMSAKMNLTVPKIKIEEGESTTTRVFLPVPITNHNFVEESSTEDEVQEEPLNCTKYNNVRPFSVIVSPKTSENTRVSCIKFHENNPTFVPVKIKEEAMDDLEESMTVTMIDKAHDKASSPYKESNVIILNGSKRENKKYRIGATN